MDNPVTEGVTLANIRQTIRRVILPLIQAIYDENPSDITLFCSGYFNNLLQKRENELENTKHQMRSYVEKSCEEYEEDMHYKYQREEPMEVENIPTNAQGSASAPHLIREKTSGSVNLRETSSWDTPSTSIEPVKSLAVLKDAAYGVGDQHFSVEKQITLEKDEKAGDADTCLKGDSAFEDDSFNEDKTNDEVKNDSNGEKHMESLHSLIENNDESFKAFHTKFERIKISDNSETLKHDESSRNDSYQDASQTKENKICRKQLSPNSSFGFVPYLNEYDSKEEMRKNDSEDYLRKSFKTQTEKNKKVTRKISETFQNSADELTCAEINFNAKFQNVKEISDVIQGRHNENRMKFNNESEQIAGNRKDYLQEEKNFMPKKSSDKFDLDNMKDEQNIRCNKIPLTFSVANKNMPGYLIPEENFKSDEAIKKGVIESMDFQQEKFTHKEKDETTFFNKNDDDNNDKSDSSESQVVVDQSWKKRWYEVHPSLENFSSSERRDPRLHRPHLPVRSSNIGAGDVPVDTFYIPNGVSNDYRDNHPRNPITSESLGSTREFNHSRFLPDDDSHRCSSARPIDISSERKTSSEKISNANPQNIPYSWRKLCKQSHSSENIVNYSKESQVRLNEETQNSSNSAKEECTSSLNEMEILSKKDVNESEEMYFEASEEISDKANFGIKRSSEKNLNQCENDEENEQNLEIHDPQLETSLKAGLYIDMKDKSQSKEHLYNQDGIISDQNVCEKDKKLQNYKQMNNENVIEDHNGILFDAQKDKLVNEHNSRLIKGEFGLDAGCGDFVSSVGDPNEQDVVSQTTYVDIDENGETERNNESSGPISERYLEEIIERVIEQQENESILSYEGQNFSSYSESDSSRLESSDLSETEDFSMNDSLQD